MTNLTKFAILMTFALSTFSFSQKAHSLTPMSSSELSSLCEKNKLALDDPNSAQCIRYIKGFIDGVLAMKKESKNFEVNRIPQNSYMQKAIKTRIGNRINNQKPSPDSQLCLDNELTLKEMVDNVATGVKQNNQKDLSALIAVYRALKDSYSCTVTN